MVRIIVIATSMIVCVCNRITESEVRKSARAGACTPEAAYACHGCEVQCGCCLDYAQEVIDEEVAAARPTLQLITSRAA